MTCCAPGAEAAAEGITAPEQDDETLLFAARQTGEGLYQLELTVPDVHCAGCIRTLETALGGLDMVDTARVNLSARRVKITFRPAIGRPSDLTRTITGAGYRVILPDPDADPARDEVLPGLIRALAVAGFAAGNIMLFSVSIWSGADAATRDLFHWISAIIAVPAVAFAGQTFFRSAWEAVRHGKLNMDVPISLAVILALCLSLFETINSGEHAFFDAAVTLLFFLLIGRTLDHVMRERARGAVRNLARLAPRRALLLGGDGSREWIAVSEIAPGMRLELKPGERVPVDATIESGTGDVDLSLVNGESAPVRVEEGGELLAGSVNLNSALVLKALRPAADSFLQRMVSLMEAAEGARTGYRRISDRAAAIYAPAVHLLALATFVGWGVFGGNWYTATTNAIAVLIITCPCALALAVPIAHVVAAGRLFSRGIMMRDGAAIERLAQIRRIAFDKTGTLTEGRPVYSGQIFGQTDHLHMAARLAMASNHPFSKALAAKVAGPEPMPGSKEVPGFGVEAEEGGDIWRLGRAAFCNAEGLAATAAGSAVWLSRNGVAVAGFTFEDRLRPETGEVIGDLQNAGFELTMLSGDHIAAVDRVADRLGLADARAGLLPEEKVEALQSFAASGDLVLMVGDGLNDAPALRAAHVSMAPASAADVGRMAADFVYTHDSLTAVPFAISIARRTSAIVKQNFGLAVAYNCVAVPLAVSGQVTPLVAALAMSSSSILVTLNALRLRLGSGKASRFAHERELDARAPVPAE